MGSLVKLRGVERMENMVRVGLSVPSPGDGSLPTYVL
jgi:hypothetical protein